MPKARGRTRRRVRRVRPAPVIKLGLIAAPVVASYSPTAPVRLVTKRLLPDNASPAGWVSPVMVVKLVFAAPVVASYSPTLPVPISPLALLATKRLLPDNARAVGSFTPGMKLGLIKAPVLRRAASTTESPFITKPRIGGTGRFLAVAVGEGRVEEGSRCTAVSFEIWTSVLTALNHQRLAIFCKLAKLAAVNMTWRVDREAAARHGRGASANSAAEYSSGKSQRLAGNRRPLAKEAGSADWRPAANCG
jgi:hypothetical protein